ncbi:MAG: hypothetical protein ACKV22_04625 [Bryobacteraceae bacterium]
MTGWTRRSLLQSAVMAPAALAQAYVPRPEPEKPPRLLLFVDWFHVKKGQLKATLDPARVTEEGKKLLEMYRRDFNLPFDQSGHGFRREDLAHGVRITPEAASKSEPWIVADKPWEEGIRVNTVLRDGDRYRCWYIASLPKRSANLTIADGRGMELSGSALAYAESRDGLAWTKPVAGKFSFNGSKENNLVSAKFNGGCIFRDDHAPPAERYKSVHFDALPKETVAKDAAPRDRYGLYGLSSPDGLQWKLHDQVLVRYFSDTYNIVAWDAQLGRYVGYFRGHHNGRSITRAETEDFWKWPAPGVFLSSNPQDNPADDLYYNGYTVYPDDPTLRLLFVSVYHRDQDTVDVRLALSRDGREFQWLSQQPIVPLGPAGRWDSGSVYAQPNLVRLQDGRLALPLTCHGRTHNAYWHSLFYGQKGDPWHNVWALWPDARLAGIEAAHYGEFTTNAAPFDGAQIQINARTGASGSITCELRERGVPIEGFSFADSVVFNGDSVWTNLRWKGKTDLTGLKGKKLDLVFRLGDAKIFACKFV